MLRIYQASNSVEAHMIVHLLGQAGISAHVQGEHLQSGMGELPAGLVAVAVHDDDASIARSIISEWESNSPPPTPDEASAQTSLSIPVTTFFLGALLSGATVWSLHSGSLSEEAIDRNNDGITDERLIYEGGRIKQVATDRNFDGKMDAVADYSPQGLVAQYSVDDDFNGRMESITFYQQGQPVRTQYDRDGDGRVEQRMRYTHGVITLQEYLDPASGSVAKRMTYRNGRPFEAQVDRDLDGDWESAYRFDEYDEPVR